MKKDLLTSFVVVELSKFLEIVVCMHSINAVFLIGDTILNCMVSSTFLYSPNGYVIQTPIVLGGSYYQTHVQAYFEHGYLKKEKKRKEKSRSNSCILQSVYNLILPLLCSGSLCSELHILFYGRVLLLYSNGSSMLMLTFGKASVLFYCLTTSYTYIMDEWLCSHSVTPPLVAGGHIHFLTCHPHMLPYGTHLIFC
ncbi:hypothetical protein Gotri_011251 [Gossypium trilobum]|uniref:Uncharacterized protein n=1 Tax=Gossypium trilobum TaxID=34281 RepID=A0A7J9ET51_9ROSI|nr:hypothetical protein [Gossypium trilobum]